MLLERPRRLLDGLTVLFDADLAAVLAPDPIGGDGELKGFADVE